MVANNQCVNKRGIETNEQLQSKSDLKTVKLYIFFVNFAIISVTDSVSAIIF